MKRAREDEDIRDTARRQARRRAVSDRVFFVLAVISALIAVVAALADDFAQGSFFLTNTLLILWSRDRP